MPTLIEMRLNATWAVRPDTKQLHGLACALFEGEAAAVDKHVAQDKPWAVPPLQGGSGATSPGWLWRAAWLPVGGVPEQALNADVIRVGHASCLVIETQRRVTRAVLAGSGELREVTVAFGSPTFFSRAGTDVVLPDPRLIVDSWRRRWNASLPAGDRLAIPDEAWDGARRQVELAAFDLRTQPRDSGHGRAGAGFTGTATLRVARGAPAQVRHMLATLARFAEFCGTGAQTTHGFGVTSLVAKP